MSTIFTIIIVLFAYGSATSWIAAQYRVCPSPLIRRLEILRCYLANEGPS